MADRGLPFTVWLTGLPCSGKTTLSEALREEFQQRGYTPRMLDGDVLRAGISADLGYSKDDRITHVDRIIQLACLGSGAKNPALVSLVSPYRMMRERARRKITMFIEVYVRCPLSVCEDRDVKGMYQLARQGKIKNFTGISDPYEEPLEPEITVDTDLMNVESCVRRIAVYLENKRLLETNIRKSKGAFYAHPVDQFIKMT